MYTLRTVSCTRQVPFQPPGKNAAVSGAISILSPDSWVYVQRPDRECQNSSRPTSPRQHLGAQNQLPTSDSPPEPLCSTTPEVRDSPSLIVGTEPQSWNGPP